MRRKLLSFSIAILLIPLVAILFSKDIFSATFELSGTVSDNLGVAVSGATVDVIDVSTSTSVAQLTTDGSGNYSVTINNGVYDVNITPPSGSNFTSAIAPSHVVEANTIINFILVPTGTSILSGHVYGPLGDPLPDQRVFLQAPGGVTYLQHTDSSGAFSIEAPTGTYPFLFIMTVNPNSFTLDAPQRYQAVVQNFNLSQSTVIDFTILAKKVDVHVQDTANNPIENTAVSTSKGNSDVQIGGGITANVSSSYGFSGAPSPTTDASGDVTLWLIPGTYNLTATPPSGSNFVATSLSNINISSDTQETITLSEAFTFSGHVYGPLGNPLPGQRVMLQDSIGTQFVTTTDNSGVYSIQAPAGTYSFLFVMTIGPNSFTLNAPQRYQAVAEDFILNADTVIDFTIPAKEITLHVEDIFNNPIENVAISTSNSGSPDLPISGSVTAFVSSSYGSSAPTPTTDTSGNVTLWLVPGNYTITATPPSGSNFVATSSSVNVTVDAQETITLPETVTFSGHVYGPLGDPLPDQRVMLQASGGVTYPTLTDPSGAFSIEAPIGTYPFLFVMNVSANSFSLNAPQRYQTVVENFTLTQSTAVDFTIPAKNVTVHVQDVANDPIENVRISTSKW